MEYADRVRGAISAGALADALGAVVEKDTLATIQKEFDASGLQGFAHVRSVRPSAFTGVDGRLPFTEDTQLTLYTMDALIELIGWANEGVAADDAACLWLAYLRWYQGQTGQLPEGIPVIPGKFLDQQPGMAVNRGPGKATLAGLASGEQGHPKKPANPEATGSGTVMRSLPFGLVPYVPVETMISMAAKGAALTHGHPDSVAAPMLLTAGIRAIHEYEIPVAEAFTERYLAPAISQLPAGQHAHQKLVHAHSLGVVHRDSGQVLVGDALVEEFGTGQFAADALAMSVYLAVTAGPRPTQADFTKAVLRAVNNSGDTDTVGALTGQILGTAGGIEVIPAGWLAELEQPDVVNEMLRQWLQTMR
ncbi:ADP-ribosylglycohydrolase family protein [Micrococcoides hystricis]|uniref:ADP-ribosylglycohydrolase family protein n=1 Tax=Micrococcoides hystricis TaxID=1572761 RepID=A0ABV6PBV8_9MICC